MLVATTDLKSISVTMNRHRLYLYYFFEVYLLFVLRTKLIGVILSPAVDALLSEEHSMVITAGNR